MSESLLEQTTNQKTDVFSVEQLNRHIRQTIEGNISTVWVKGEISNFKPHSSGHFYFSLKDAQSQIKAVMFRGYNSRLKFKPKDGLEVIVRGKISVYEPRGDYQVICEMMEPVGAGALQKAFEDLKIKLKNEGLFESSRKRPIPLLPQHVAIVTSPTGAAIRDMLNVLSRRNRSVRITLVPTNVQGESAAPLICEAMKKAYLLQDVDAIIVGRGGGSIEDMWCFNDETLARVIASSPVPVISAIGHEIDFTIADFVADLRAPTPSAAAELVVKSADELSHKILSFQKLLFSAIQKHLKTDLHRFRAVAGRLVDPKRKLQDLILRNDELISRLNNAVQRYLKKRNVDHQMIITKFKNKFIMNFERVKSRMKEAVSILDSLSPLKVVERGYSLTLHENKIIKSADQLKVNDEISIVLMKGQLQAKVIEINKKESPWILKKN